MSIVSDGDSPDMVRVFDIEIGRFTWKRFGLACFWSSLAAAIVFAFIVAMGYGFFGNAPHVGASALQSLI